MSALDAIADPVRLRVVRHLARTESATLPELSEAAGVHLNTVRPHIDALIAASVLVREPQAPSGRGRPRIGYRLAGDWSPPTADYRGLAELLAALEDPGLVCDLAAAVADGALSARGTGLAVWGREHDPQRRACSLPIEPSGGRHAKGHPSETGSA